MLPVSWCHSVGNISHQWKLGKWSSKSSNLAFAVLSKLQQSIPTFVVSQKVLWMKGHVFSVSECYEWSWTSLAKNACVEPILFQWQSRTLDLGCHTNLRDTYSTEPSSKTQVRPKFEQQASEIEGKTSIKPIWSEDIWRKCCLPSNVCPLPAWLAIATYVPKQLGSPTVDGWKSSKPPGMLENPKNKK